MRCRGCGTTILDAQAARSGGYCKPCAKDAGGRLVRDSADIAPSKEEEMPKEEMVKEKTPSAAASEFPPLPEGFRYVYNRLDAPFEMAFNMQPVVFTAHEVRPLPAELAEFLRAHSIITGTVRMAGRGQLRGERAIALGPGWMVVGSEKTSEGTWRLIYGPALSEAEFEVPSTIPLGATWFDTKAVPNYVERPSKEGMPTHPELVRV